jgi:hypothetical protein
MQVIPRSGIRLLPAFMRTRFYFYCATQSTSNLRASAVMPSAVEAKLLQYLPFIPFIPHYITHLSFRLHFNRCMFMPPGHLLCYTIRSR